MSDEQSTTEMNAQPVSSEAQSSSGQLRDRRVRPEGVVPKEAQGYVVAGLAVLILMAVMFSKNHAKPAPKETISSPVAVSNDMNQRKIQELEQDLSADERQSQHPHRLALFSAAKDCSLTGSSLRTTARSSNSIQSVGNHFA
jgi:hypothetical protein